MDTKKWFGGALVLSAALSLAIVGGAWAQSSQEKGYGGGSSSSYGSEPGYQKGKKMTPPAKSGNESSMGVCTPQSCPGSKKPKSSTGRTPEPDTTK
jgi:hypothetical protein